MKIPKPLQNFIQKTLEDHFWIILLFLITVVLGTLVISLFLSFIAPDKYLAPLILSSAAITAMLTYWREHDKASKEQKRVNSEFFFRNAANGLEEVLNLLRDQNNERAIWIRAARSLIESRKLAEKINLKEFQDAYQLYEHRIRNDLYLTLTVYDPHSGDRQPLPPQFFYGDLNWREENDLDDTAKKTSPEIKVYQKTTQQMNPEPQMYPLSEESICAIFDFLDYPKDYDDPLQKVQIWDQKSDPVFGEKKGAAMYIAHKKQYLAIDGKLVEREPTDNPN